MTITPSPKTEDEFLTDLLIKGAQSNFRYEHQIDQNRFLELTEKVTDNVWVLTTDHGLYEEGSTSFIVTLLPDWDDEEITYEYWRDEYLTEEVRFWLEDHFDLGQKTEIEELREGSYWTTFLVRFKK